MIKAALHNRETDEVTLVLGVTDDNTQRLLKGQPILINLAELGMTLVKDGISSQGGQIMIFHGKDESALAAELLGMNVKNPGPGDETRIKYDRKDKRGHGHGG